MKAEREGDKCKGGEGQKDVQREGRGTLRPKETGGRDNCRGKENLNGWKGGRKS